MTSDSSKYHREYSPYGSYSPFHFEGSDVITVLKNSLEYNITYLSIKKTGRKPCSIREHIIGIVIVSQRDFDNVTCVWSYNVYAL